MVDPVNSYPKSDAIFFAGEIQFPRPIMFLKVFFDTQNMTPYLEGDTSSKAHHFWYFMSNFGVFFCKLYKLMGN